MASELVLSLRLPSQTPLTIKLSDVNLKTKVEELRIKAAGRTNLPKDSFGKRSYILLFFIFFSNLYY